ncbi:MAG: DUF1573 domain-containing protein [Muribaculaceae bacterium]|nr:DUF1573 domain-containing protein [Muribaculaceae bacterium]MDE6753102.1 DUF1573 domain-containing protein [Muribaculaceae bacterium]
MNRRILILIAATLWSAFLFNVRSQVRWLATEYDYGTFREAAGPQKGSVQFINESKEPTFINSVRPSCGCTAAAYTESMIQPGDTATVSFIYNPYGRPGRFDKTVKVFLGKENEMKVIRIRGTVIGQPETLKTTYPYTAGPLRIEKLTVPVGEIVKGGSRHLFLNIYNQSEDTIRPKWINSGRALEIEMTPSALAPGDIGTLGFYLRTPLEKEMGPVEYPVTLIADSSDPHSEQKEIKVTAVITPNPKESLITSGSEVAHLYVRPEFVDLGEVTGDELRKFRFQLVNDGSSSLKIERIYCLDDAVKLKKTAAKIKPGKNITVEGELRPGRLNEGPFRINIEIMSSDPLNPVKTVRVVGMNTK